MKLPGSKENYRSVSSQAELGHSKNMDTIRAYGNHEYDGNKQEVADVLNEKYAPLVEKMSQIK